LKLSANGVKFQANGHTFSLRKSRNKRGCGRSR